MIRFINCFEVPVGRDEEFLELWGAVNEYMQGKPGYVGHRLHRALSDDARYRFVNYVEWASVEHWAAAHDEGFRELVGCPGWEHFTTTPATYEIVHGGGTITNDEPAALAVQSLLHSCGDAPILRDTPTILPGGDTLLLAYRRSRIFSTSPR